MTKIEELWCYFDTDLRVIMGVYNTVCKVEYLLVTSKKSFFAIFLFFQHFSIFLLDKINMEYYINNGNYYYDEQKF